MCCFCSKNPRCPNRIHWPNCFWRSHAGRSDKYKISCRLLETGLSTSNKKITADKQSIKMEHIPKIKGLTPYIEVFDMPLSLKFYRDVLGFSIIMSSGKGDDVNWVLLQLENAQLMLNTAYEKDDRPKEPDPTRI